MPTPPALAALISEATRHATVQIEAHRNGVPVPVYLVVDDDR